MFHFKPKIKACVLIKKFRLLSSDEMQAFLNHLLLLVVIDCLSRAIQNVADPYVARLLESIVSQELFKTLLTHIWHLLKNCLERWYARDFPVFISDTYENEAKLEAAQQSAVSLNSFSKGHSRQ